MKFTVTSRVMHDNGKSDDTAKIFLQTDSCDVPFILDVTVDKVKNYRVGQQFNLVEVGSKELDLIWQIIDILRPELSETILDCASRRMSELDTTSAGINSIGKILKPNDGESLVDCAARRMLDLQESKSDLDKVGDRYSGANIDLRDRLKANNCESLLECATRRMRELQDWKNQYALAIEKLQKLEHEKWKEGYDWWRKCPQCGHLHSMISIPGSRADGPQQCVSCFNIWWKPGATAQGQWICSKCQSKLMHWLPTYGDPIAVCNDCSNRWNPWKP
jgi:DNA-directed RNA polymerase subunit RPC12/RpoP